MGKITQIRQGFALCLVLCSALLLSAQSHATTNSASDKIVKKLEQHWQRASRQVLISTTDFYDADSHLSLPLALTLHAQLVTALEKQGFEVIEPSNDISTAWVIQCRWKQQNDKLSITFIAKPWKDWKLGRVSISSKTMNRGDFADALFEPDMDAFSRTLVHRLALNDTITQPRSVYLRPIVVNGAVGGKSANHYFNNWLKNAVDKSNLLLPIDPQKALAKLSTKTILTRGFTKQAKTQNTSSSLTGDLLSSQSELSGSVDLKTRSVKINVDLLDQDGKQLSTSLVNVPFDSLPRLIANDLRQTSHMQAEKKVAQNGLQVEISTTRGEGETLYRKGEVIQFLLRSNRDAYIYLFDLDANDHAVMLYPAPSQGAPVKKVPGREVLILPGDALPYEIVVSEPFGQDIIWAVASDVKLAIPEDLTGDWANVNTLKQRVRKLGQSTAQGYAEAQVLVTTSP